jgi:thiamine-monophosphate kinase
MRKPIKPEEYRTKPERLRLRELVRNASRRKFPHLALGVGDDAALLRPPAGHEIVVTTDFSLEGVHFRRDWHEPVSAGHRCLARGLSDLAAMGAQPLAAFLSLALPLELSGTWADGFFAGLLALARRYKVPLAGGDLARSPGTGQQAHVLADIVLVGSVPRGKALLRSSSRPGDIIYVTGLLGGAAAELELLGSSKSSAKRKALHAASGAHPHLFPEPRISAGLALRKLGGRVACLDISDGLALDLSRLCEASGVSAELDAAALPMARGASLDQALYGGEDYELLFTAPPRTRVPSRLGGVRTTRIGRIATQKRRQPQLTLVSTSGQSMPLEPRGWVYFT